MTDDLAERLAHLSAEADDGPFEVRIQCTVSTGPDERHVAFLFGPDETINSVLDEDPKLNPSCEPAPTLTFFAELANAYRTGTLVPAEQARREAGEEMAMRAARLAQFWSRRNPDTPSCQDLAVAILRLTDQPAAERAAPACRVQWNDDGTLDEVVTDGGCHLEEMDRGRWFLSCLRADGSEFAVWINGKVVLTEERPAPTREGEG